MLLLLTSLAAESGEMPPSTERLDGYKAVHHSEVNLRKRVSPLHPSDWQGQTSCSVRFYVSAEGTVDVAESVDCPDALASLAEDAAQRWLWYPVKERRKPVAVYFVRRIDFQSAPPGGVLGGDTGGRDPVTYQGLAYLPNDAPKPVKQSPPAYPEAMKELEAEGVCLMRVLVDPDGTVADVQPVKCPVGFQDSAAAALSEWRFEPAVDQGEPQRVYYDIAVRFELK